MSVGSRSTLTEQVLSAGFFVEALGLVGGLGLIFEGVAGFA